MATLEVQVQQAKGDILRQAQQARTQVQTEASRALRREPGVFEVGRTVAVEGVPQAYQKEVREWQEKQLSRISQAEREAQSRLETVYQAAKATAPTYEGLTPEEEALLKQGYDVEEINRRRQLAAQREYEEALAKEERDITEKNVLVAGKWYIPKEDYAALSAEDKKLIQQIGVDQFNRILDERDRQFKAENVFIANKDWVSKTFYDKLSTEDKNLMRQVGVERFDAIKDAELKRDNIQVTIQGKEEWINREEWNRLTPGQQKEVRDTGQYTTVGEGKELTVLPKGFIGPPAPGEIRYEDLTAEQKSQLKETSVYVVKTPTGEQKIPAETWEGMSLGAQLKVAKGRIPALREYTAGYYALVQSKPQKVPFDPGKAEIAAAIAYGKEFGISKTALEILKGWPRHFGLPAISTTLETGWETVTTKEKWITALGAAMWASPLIIKGTGLVATQISKAAVRLPGPIIRPQMPIKVGFELHAPITSQKFTVGTVAGKQIWLPAGVRFQAPVTGLGVKLQTPVKLGWGTGLERAGLPKEVSQLAFGAGKALKELRVAEATLGKVSKTSPQYQQLAYDLWQAQRNAQVADSAFLRSLSRIDVGVTGKQLSLIEEASGYKGIKTPLLNLAKSQEVVKSTYSFVRDAEVKLRQAQASKLPTARAQVKLWEGSLARAKSAYEAAKVKFRAAHSVLSAKMKPRYGELLPEKETQMIKADWSKGRVNPYVGNKAVIDSVVKGERSLGLLDEPLLATEKALLDSLGLKTVKMARGQTAVYSTATKSQIGDLSRALRDTWKAKTPSEALGANVRLGRALGYTPDDIAAYLRDVADNWKWYGFKKAPWTLEDIATYIPEWSEAVGAPALGEPGLPGIPPEAPLGREPYMGEPGATSWSPLSPEARARVQAISDASAARYYETLGIKPLTSRAPTALLEEPVTAVTPTVTPVPQYLIDAFYAKSILGPHTGLPGFGPTPVFSIIPTITPGPLGILAVSFLPAMAVRPSGLAIPGEVYPDVELVPGRIEESPLTWEDIERMPLTQIERDAWIREATRRQALAPAVSPYVIPGTRITTRGMEWVSPAIYTGTSIAPWTGIRGMELPWTGLAPTTTPYTSTVTRQALRVVPTTRMAIQPKTVTRPLTRTRVGTAIRITTKPVTSLRVTPKIRIPFKFLWLPIPSRVSKKKKFGAPKVGEERRFEPYPGVYPGLVLHFPTPLEEVKEPLRPRPVIKKRRIPLRKKGTYPVAGFRELR